MEEGFGESIKDKRKVGIYLSHRYSGKTLTEIAEWYGEIKESGISQIVRRLSLQRARDRDLNKRIVDIERRLREWEEGVGLSNV